MYQVSFNMAVDIVHSYLEKIYALDRHKGTSAVKVQRMFDLSAELKGLVEQLRQDHPIDEIIREIKQSLEQQYLYPKLEIFIDGAARGNDNPQVDNASGLAFAVYGSSQNLYQQAVYLGSKIVLPRLRNEEATAPPIVVEVTNNVAEYMALIQSLEYLLYQKLSAQHIEIFSDSSLVVNQVNMENSTKAPHLIRLRNVAQELLDEFDNITITHIPREQNAYVDGLVNQMLDEVQREAAMVG